MRKLDSTITVTLSFPRLLSILATMRGGGLARVRGDFPYPANGDKQIALPVIKCGVPLPEDCEVVSAVSSGDRVIVTLWHESFINLEQRSFNMDFGCCSLIYNDSEPSRQELIDGLERNYPTST